MIEDMKALILSISSDIGIALTDTLLNKGYEIYGTYKRKKPNINIPNANFFQLDIKDFDSTKFKNWLKTIGNWDLFISCIGTLEPVGELINIDLNEWVEAIAENSSYQIAALINAIRIRPKKNYASVILFAGGGTNSATTNYSSYTLGKISLIKAVELLDKEINHIKFSIIGPGWVKTKIHKETLNAKENAGLNYSKTLEMINNPDKFNPMDKVINDVCKIISLPKDLVGGRNFSSVHDNLSLKNLKKLKDLNADFYKLRRSQNEK